MVKGHTRKREKVRKQMSDLLTLADLVEQGKHLEAARVTEELLEEGIHPKKVLIEGLQKGMLVLGERFKRDECFIPEVLLAARAMSAGMDVLRPSLARSGSEPVAKIVLGTVKDDLHDLGKNMVGMMLEGSGFGVIDMGINVPAERFIDAVERENAPVLAMSTLLSTTMPYLKTTIDALQSKGIRQGVKILVGGAPVSEEYAREIGADGYAPDAARAVDEVKKLLSVSA